MLLPSISNFFKEIRGYVFQFIYTRKYKVSITTSNESIVDNKYNNIQRALG